jgi:diketogulonate reductase-like aldo/keto reductase
VVQEIAARHRRPASEIVLRWIIQQGVAAIPMTRKRENAASNLRAADFTLSPEEMDAISALSTRNLRLINPSWMTKGWD